VRNFHRKDGKFAWLFPKECVLARNTGARDEALCRDAWLMMREKRESDIKLACGEQATATQNVRMKFE
jgi:hypothetical protein